jgi:hypothetical protein
MVSGVMIPLVRVRAEEVFNQHRTRGKNQRPRLKRRKYA